MVKHEIYQVVDEIRTAVAETLQIQLYPSQVEAGVSMSHGTIIQMATGEGKTLAALIPAVYFARLGDSCHIVTSNDYLAKRDALQASSILRKLNISVGFIAPGMNDEDRRRAYACNVTYGTGSEMGFDFLRDQINLDAIEFQRTHVPIQNRLNAVVVDEADSLLIDDARTPLLISCSVFEPQDFLTMCEHAYRIAMALRADADFVAEIRTRRVWLTASGCERVCALARSTKCAVDEELLRQVELSLLAIEFFQLDRDYIIESGEITIVSESTGRQLTGRIWQKHLHAAISVKESVEFVKSSQPVASISVNEYFSKYTSLCGMTGTATTVKREFRKFYGCNVATVKLRTPSKRVKLAPRVFYSMQAKNIAIVDEVIRRTSRGGAVLIGTASVEASNELSEHFASKQIQHQLLNATHHEREAEIIACAGQPKQVTIATNMAGRGTDIRLSDTVRSMGGLLLIATELNSDRRIDRQLYGRVARQGDPGSYQLYLSLEDELLVKYAPTVSSRLRSRFAKQMGELPNSVVKHFVRAQKLSEKATKKQRRQQFQADQKRKRSAIDAGLNPYLDFVRH